MHRIFIFYLRIKKYCNFFKLEFSSVFKKRNLKGLSLQKTSLVLVIFQLYPVRESVLKELERTTEFTDLCQQCDAVDFGSTDALPLLNDLCAAVAAAIETTEKRRHSFLEVSGCFKILMNCTILIFFRLLRNRKRSLTSYLNWYCARRRQRKT